MTTFILFVKELLNKIYLLYQKFEKITVTRADGKEIFFLSFIDKMFSISQKTIIFLIIALSYLISNFDCFQSDKISKITNNNKLVICP